MPSQLEILHRSLKANNYDVPDDYESFRSTLTAKGEEGYNNRYTLWKSLRDNNYDVPDDYNTFRDALFTPTKPAAGAQQKTTPAAVPQGTRRQAAGRGTTTNRTAAQSQEGSTGTGDWRQQMMVETGNLVRRTKQQVQQTANQVKYNQKRAGLQTQPVNLGQNPDVVEEETGRWDTETGAPEKRYLTSSGTEYEERAAADLEENVNDLQEYEQTVPGQLRKIDEQIASLEQRISEQESQREIDWVDADGRVHYKDGRTSDEAISNLDLALRDLKNARTMLQRDQQLRKSSDFLGGVGLPFTGDWFNNWKNFGYGIWDSLNDRSMYDFGLSDLQKAGAYMRIKNKIENGQELTEQETDLALAGMALAQAEQSVDLPTGYTAGETTAQMAPFMAQMAANPASGVGRAFARGAVRKFGRDGVKAVAMRAGARVLGNMAEAAALTGTLQAGQTAANVMNRYTGDTFEYDEEGKLHIGHWEEGEDGQPTFIDGGKGAARSIYEGVTSSIIENFTELGLGGNLNKFLGKMAASKGGQAIGLGYITDLVGKVGSTPFARGMKKFAERTNWNGLIEEPLEEEYGIILNALLTGDNKISDLWDSKQQADIFAGTMWFGGFMAGMNLAAYPFARRKMKKDLRAADINGQYAFGDEWDVIKSGIEEMDDNAVVDYLYGLKDDGNFNAEQKAALFAYTSRLKQYQGANTASMLMRMEGNLDENEAAQQNAYESGSEAEGPERNEVLKRYEAARQAVAEVFSIDEEEVDSRLGVDENSENAIADKALQVDFGEQVLEYLNARAAYNGMLDRVGDDIEAQVQASNEEVSRITNETGQVVGATMKADGSQVYVVSGDPATAETLVVRNAETGELKMIAPDALQNIEEPINADELRLQREVEITNAGMQQAENEIEGKREFQLNDVVTLADGRQGQLGGVTPDGAFLLYTDDGKVAPVTNDQLNELATEVNGSPVEAAVPQQQTEEAEEEQPEKASVTENAENYAQNEGEIIPGEEAAIVSQQTEQEAEGTGEQPVVDADAMPMVGEGEDAEPDFSRAEPARAHRFIYDEAGLSRDEADQFIDANKMAADSALAKLQKKQPKIGTSLAKYRKEQAAWQQQVDEAQRQVDYWTNVQQIQQERVRAEQEAEFQARQEEAAGRQALLDEQRDLQAKIQTAKRVYGDYFDDDFTVPHDVMELVAMNMPRNISWEGREGVRGLQQELGLRRGVGRSADSNAFNSYLAKKGEGIGVEQAVHNIWESAMNELSNGDKRYDDSEIRNALLDMFMSAEKPSDIRDYVLNARIAEAEATRAAEDEAMRAAELDAWADAYNLTPEEREGFEDYIENRGEEISSLTDEDIQNIIAIFAEQETNIENHEQNRGRTGLDREPDEGRAPSEVEGGEGEILGQGAAEDGGSPAEGRQVGPGDEVVSGDNVSGGAQVEGGIMPAPDVDAERIATLKQALTDAYRSGDAAAIGQAAAGIRAYVDEGLDDEGVYDEAIDDYEGDDPEILTAQYLIHVYQDRYLDDDEDQEYIRTGLRRDLRENVAATQSQQTEPIMSWTTKNGRKVELFVMPETIDEDGNRHVKIGRSVDGGEIQPSSTNGINVPNDIIDYDATYGDAEAAMANDKEAETVYKITEVIYLPDGRIRARGLIAGEKSSFWLKRDPLVLPSEQLKSTDLRDVVRPESPELGVNAANAKARTDNQGNPVDENGKLIVEKINSIEDLSDDDFVAPTRSVELPNIRRKVRDAIGAGDKPIIIKKNIFEKNARNHADLTPEQSREILLSALYNPNLYGQNRKATKPFNWVVINTKDAEGRNRLVLLEVNDTKDNVEIVHWHYLDDRGVEKIKRQAEREGGQILILPSEEEAGALSSRTLDSSSEGKDTNNSPNTQENLEKSSIQGLEGYSTSDVLDIVRGEIQNKLDDAGLDGVNIKGMALHGSRMRGNAREDSDLDVVVEYEGNISEDGLFNILNEEPIEIEGVVVDVNPITKYKSGTLEQYMKRSQAYDAEVMAATQAQQTENTLGTTSSAEEIAAQEARVDTNPTEAQKEAGNYQKGHIKVDGFYITIENPKGSVRRGTDASGQPWEVTMNNTYGYIRGTEGVDGDHIDVFLSDNPTSGNVFVVDQVNPDGTFDEHKVMYGFADAAEAMQAYLSNYSPGWKGMGAISGISREEFKKWVESSHRKTKPFREYALAKRAAVAQQQTEQREAAANYTITDAEYKTKRGKVLNMRLVKFERELTPEEQKAANALAKESRGWWSRDDGGFLMRDDESARAFAEKVMTPTDMADAKPLSLEDMQKATDDRQEQQSELTPAQEEQPVQNEQQPTQKSQWVDDEDAARFEELKRRMRAKLGGQMNMGVDPEILAIGAEMAFYVVKHGARKFGEYARVMVEELGDAIRPYLKSFYNGAREFPEMEQYAEDMTPYEEVRAFDVANFDKPVMDAIATAQQIVNEQEAEKQAEEAEKNLKDQRNEERKQTEQENTRPATPEDLEQAPLVWYQGKKYGIMMLVHEGSQVSATQFEKPRIVRVVLSNGQSVEPDELRVDNTVQAPVVEAEPVQYDLFGNPIQEPVKKSSRKTEKKSAKVSDSQEKVVSLQKENEVNDEAANAEQQNAGIRHEQGSERKPSGTGERAGQEAQRADDARRRGGSEPNRSVQPGLQRLTQEVATQSQQNERNTDWRVPNGDTSEPVPTRPAGELSGSGSHSTQFTQPQNLRNNRAERGKDYAPKGVDARIEANINAIELMQRLMENGEQATPVQMKVLRQYSGWGGLGKAFSLTPGPSPNGEGSNYSQRLRQLLGDEAYEQANMSRNSAYYTPAMVIDSMWDIARAMGFRGGNVLEGSAGIGNIIGAMPKDMSERSSIHAVEIDQTTGNILSLLYPDAQVDVQGFEQTQVENGSVDLAITNVPFVTGLRVMDTTGDKDLSRKFHDIHDFCIAKNIRKLREGGIGIFITSSGTLDNSTKLREWIVGEGGADVVGAFRLNNDTFGGTGATSDIIVVRKRVNGKKSANAIDVLPTTGVRVADYDTGETKKVKGQYVPVVKQLSMDYNKYFAEHPENMGGEMKFAFEEGDTFRPTSKALYPVRGKNQGQLLKDWVESFAGKTWEAAVEQQQTEQQPAVYEKLGADVKEGSMVVSNGELCVAQRGKAVPLGLNATKVKGKTKVECFNSYQNIKKSLADVLVYQTENEGDEGLKPLLDKLNRAYDSFVRTFGHLHKNTSIVFLRNDVDWPNILALEKFAERATVDGKRVQEYGKTDIFKARVVEKEKEPTVDNVRDGIIASIYQFGRIDVPWMVEQLNKAATRSQHTEQEVRDEIVKSGLGFEDPGTKEMVVSYEYLSGNVREKLQQAQDNNSDGHYDANIRALEKVVPMDIPAHLIDFSIGSSWIDPKLYEDYVKEKTGIDVQFTNAGGTWYMKAPRFLNEEKNRAMGVHSEMLRKTVFGTQLMEAAMQNKTITVSETHKKWDGSTETIIDKEATAACGNKIDEIRQDFKDWARGRMQADDEYARQVERKYNDMFNNYVPKSIPDEFVPAHFGGASMKITLRPHQAKAVIRGTTQPLLLAHEVGTGKTFTLISTAMEMRRLGTARKPMIVVQNATVGQFVESAKVLYPNAKVLTLEDKDHTGEGRKNFYAKIKYNDWDMIVVPQSVFERIPDSEERQMAYIQDKIDEKMAVLEQMKDADAYGESAIVRQAQKEIEQLEAEKAALTTQLTERKKEKDEKKAAVTRQNAAVRAQEMLDRETDDVENFDDMGIDAILVDEAHEYKHLGFATAMQRGVKGVDPSYSKKAQGVYLKTQAVLEKNNGRNVIFATGTPISNTAAEIWTFMRYLMPADTMKEYDIYYFDDFVRNFGNLQQMLEFTTSGKFKENNRFAGYVNLPELVRIWSGVADTVLTKEAGGVKDKIPELEGGKAQDLYLPQTKALRSVMKFVKAQLEEYEKMSGKEKKENSHIPLTMYGIAKAAAVDARLVVDDAQDDEHSKTNEAVRQTLKSLEETKSYKGTVAIFADNYQNKHSGFNLYEDIRKKLVAAGVPEEQIVVMKSGMSVKKKLEIFDKVNRGEVRVIMGSTFTLGTGVNIQERLHTLIHVDAPNRPMDYTQRNGRILRQGNLHKEMGKPVRVLRFGVEDSLDVTAYQRLKTKGAIADSIMNGKQMMANSMENRVLEEEEDVFGDTVAQLSGSEYAMLKNQAEKDVRKYEAKRKQWEFDQTYVHSQIPKLEGQIKTTQKAIENNKRYLERVATASQHTGPMITIGQRKFENVEAMGDYIKDFNKSVKAAEDAMRESGKNDSQVRRLTINVGGIDFEIVTEISVEIFTKGVQLFTGTHRVMTYSCEELGIVDAPVKQSLLREALSDITENVITGNDFRERIERGERAIERDEDTLQQLRERDGKPFEYADELAKAHERYDEYTELMKKELEEKEKKYAEMDAEVSEAADVVDAEEAEEDSSEDEGVRFRSGDGDDLLYRLREEPAPEKTGIGYKVFVLKDGMLYPPMVANPNGAETPVGVWLDADAAPVAGTSKTGRLQVKAGGKGTQGGSGKLAYRPGWHLGTIPYALQFNRNNPETGERELFPANFVWAEVEYANDVDYQEEAMSYGYNQNGKFQHSLAGLPRVPKDGAYTYRTNPNPATDPWIITGAMKVNRILKPSEVDQLVRDAGREPQPRQEGAITDEQVEALNNELGTLNREGEEIPAPQRKRARTARERRQAEAYAQRQWRRAHVVADEAIRLLGLEGRVTVMDFPIGLTGKRAKAKGWYDTKTGKIVVVMNNHRSPEDVFKTILHEGVAHYGLRQLFGEHFDTFLDEVYKNATPEIRGAIDAEIATRSQQTEQKARREATEEYLARLAEDTDFERAMRQGWWQKIKSAFLDMLHKLGFGEYAGPALTDNELRYILWRSYENLKDQKREREGQRPLRRNVWNPFKAAEDIVMQENLKVGNFEPTPSPSLNGREKEQRQAAEPKRPTLSVASMQPRNAVEQMYQDFKERYGNAMLMMRDNDNYFALGDDALKMERLFAGRRFIHGVMSDGHYSIPVSELDMVLPVLVRAGNRVAIADAPTGNTAREGEPEVEWQDSRRIMERLAERYNSKELVFFDLTMDDEELFESLSFLHPFRNEINDVEDFSDFMAFVREKLNEDKAQAFYNVDSKKIFIFADRLKPKKAEEVFFHENIHGVLHDWYGDGARTIADRFWNIAPEKGKTNKSHVTANYDAEEQHEELFTYWLAKSMVDGSVDDMLNMFADADKQRIENILKTIGYDRERETEERKPRGAEDVSERAGGESLQGLQVQETIGYDKGRENSTRRRIYPSIEGRNSQDQGDQLQGSLQNPDEEDLGLHFRSGDSGGFTSARAQYEAKTAGGAFKFRESWQDSMLSLKRLQDAIAAESGEDIEDFENAYLAENRMHGKSKNEAEHYDRNYYQPLLHEVHQLVDYLAEQEVADPFGRGGVVTYQTVDDYLKAKHGLERNQVFAFREAAKQKAKETIDEQKRQLQQDADDGNITTDELRKELKRLDEDFGKTVQGIIDAFANDPEVVRQKRNYENGLLTYSEYLSALIPLRKKYVMRAEPKTDDGGNVVSDNYYDEHERDYGGLSELMSPEDYATIEALREMASLTIDPENKRELYKRVREEEERVYREAQEEAMKAVDAIEVDSTMKEKRDNGTIVPFVYLRDTAERRKHISDLWSRVNDATKKTLQTSYEGGMMSREQYNNVRAMFDYYVPLRGWEDNNAEDVYDYVAKRSAFSPSVKRAYGRASKADSPLATIGNMAVSQIIISNKNLMRQHFLNMVLNHPSSLISVSEKWYVRMGDVDGEAVWEEREPDIKPGMTADEIASEIETFNEEMRQLQEQGDAIPAKGKLHLNLHATKAQKDEHVVEVQRNGKVYKLYINGNPRAAQALNGTNITEGDAAWMQNLSRTMAANFTSRNPAFIISNLSRDFTMAAASVVIKEDKAYSKKFAENAVKVLRPRMGRAATRSQRTILTGLLPSLMRKYLRGELDPIDETERYFQEFMEQGGETGFTNMLSVEKFKLKMEKEFKKTAGHEMDLAKAFGMMADTFEFYNRCAEDATRFIVYMTSRQMGKSVVRSIADAKDVTLNFNRKGAGGMGNATFRNIYIFVNPAIQALSNVYEMMTKHKLKFAAVTLSWVAAGAVLPILNTLMLNLLGGDDDKDTYWDLPDYVRKNNAVFWVPGTHTFVTIPLAQEFRVFYGIGELVSAMSMGHTPDSWGMETLSSVMDLMPVNPTGAGGDLLVDFMPTPLQPIVQARDNINFTGYPIYRDNQGNKYEPTWQKAYHGTPSWMVKTSKLLNEATGGNDHYQGWIDGTLTNPALWNHMLQGYLGGMYSFLAHSAGVVTDVVSGEMPKMYEVPIANRFINVPLEREKRARLGNEYYDLVKEHDRMQSMMAKYRKDAKGEDPELKETAERYVDMAKEIDKKIDWERNGKTYEPQTSIDAGFEKRYRRYKKIHDYKRSIEKVVNGESKKSENRLNQLVREMQESLRNINEDF